MTRRFNCMRVSAALLLAAALFGHATPSRAVDLDRKPSLRANVSVRSDLVTIADFFEGAGTTGSTAIFRSPDLGKTGTVSAAKVVLAAKAAGLYDATAGSLVNVTVTHEARQITQDDIQRLISDAAVKQADLPEGSELQISFDVPLEVHETDANSGNPMHLGGLTYSPITGRFEAIVIFDVGNGVERERLRGSAVEMVPTLNLTRAINRGDIIAADDVVTIKQPRRVVGNVKAIEASQIIGMAAKRTLRPDNQITLADFAPPVLVARGDTVTLVFELPGIMLTARGTAQDSGIKGESVTVLNPTSKRIVHGTVVGQGKVQVVGGILTANADDSASSASNGRQQQ
jgi:flagella basal body P-ring formation protein FlgA